LCGQQVTIVVSNQLWLLTIMKDERGRDVNATV
jgi:hypothetical protein